MKKYLLFLTVMSVLVINAVAVSPIKKDDLPPPAEPKGTISLKDAKNDNGKLVELRFMPGNKVSEIAKYYIDITIKNTTDDKITTKEVINSESELLLTIDVPHSNTPVHVDVYTLNENGEKNIPFAVADVVSKAEWINSEKIKPSIYALFFIVLIIYLIKRAKMGANLYIRRIAGLEALDDAIGRATEMGKPVFYIPGTSTMDDIATIASLNILRPVAQDVAKYETPLRVPIIDPIVLTVAQDVTKEAYISAGRPDLYNEGTVFLASVGQFAYAGAVSGMMVREKPATVFLLGYFNAESLILAETANSIGAIQISGTDSTAQLPFFIAACDYTLIGEELYAASAYLSREPLLLGTLKAQDVIKGILIAFLFLGIIANIFGTNAVVDFLLNYKK